MSKILQLMPGGIIPLEIGSVRQVRLESLLGSGGYGSVWKCSDMDTGLAHALKVIQGLTPGSVLVDRVRLEAGVRIPSKHVVSCEGLFEWDANTILLLFEYFEAQSLADLLESGSLSNAQKKSVFEQVLAGTRAAHAVNVIHRDIKPANVLVSGDLTKLIDFGISKFKGRGLTVTGEMIGTPEYMAPELLVSGSKDADARADIYSLGCLLYEVSMGLNCWKARGWKELTQFVRFLASTPPPEDAIDFRGFHCDFVSDPQELIRAMTKIDAEKRLPSVDAACKRMGLELKADPAPPPPDHSRLIPQFIVESGSNKGAQTVLTLADGEERPLGRPDIAGADTSISRVHLLLRREAGRFLVRDGGSKNGTFIAGLPLADGEPHELHHGDRLKAGDVFLRFALLRMA